MQIYIDGKSAVIKKDTSFEYVSENRLFGGAEGYSLSISLPMKDCPQNQRIFGRVNRLDVLSGKVRFDCEIRTRQFFKRGCATIVELSDDEIKIQFLEGRSEQNFDWSLEDVYINEMNLGAPASTSKSIPPSQAWTAEDAVALPWVNTESKNIQNCAVKVSEPDEHYEWHEDTQGLSWQPYLLTIAKAICREIEYDFDFSAWENREDLKYLLVCNTLPYAWYMPQFARALPHWSVKEFFEKLELFLGAEFDFDHREKTVSMAFSKSVVESKPVIKLKNILEEFTVGISQDSEKSDYSGDVNLSYKECSHNMQKFYSCDWFLKSWKDTAYFVRYDTLAELIEENRCYQTFEGSKPSHSNVDKLLYAADVDRYFMIRILRREDSGRTAPNGSKVWRYFTSLQPLNLFGPHIENSSANAAKEELDFVPACVDDTDEDNGLCLFLDFSGMDDNEGSEEGISSASPGSEKWIADMNNYFPQTVMEKSLKVGESEKKAEYYDKIYVAWYKGSPLVVEATPPHPFVEDIVVNWHGYRMMPFSLRLNDRAFTQNRGLAKIDYTRKYTVKFLASEIPDARSVYYIKGHYYLCAKITATFTESGMSQLLKGEFYPLAE